MRKQFVVSATLLLAAALSSLANAGTFTFGFAGPGVSGDVNLTYGLIADGKYAQALEVTGVNGIFTDTNNGLGIVNAPIGPLEPIKHDTPELGNLLAPLDFSRFPVSSGLPVQNNGFLTYDNLYWPTGSVQTATSYPVFGGFLDIYGLMFDIGGGKVVNFWSNGDSGSGPDYGVAVATSATALDYVSGGVMITPEPNALVLLAVGLATLLLWRWRSAVRASY